MPEAACKIVDEGTLSYESAVQSMQSLINQTVVAGSNCVILVGACHYLFAIPSVNPNFSMLTLPTLTIPTRTQQRL